MDSINILALNGSPNEKGNTWALLDSLTKELEALGAKTDIVHVPSVLKASNCYYCTSCTNPCQGICHAGTVLGDLYEQMKYVDGIILGSPVYFGTVSAQLKAFFDMTRQLRSAKGLINTVGAGVTVGASKFGGQETTMRALHDMMFVEGMLIVGDGFVEDDCGHHGICAVRPASEDVHAQKRITILSKRLMEVCLATKSIRKR